MNVNLFTGVHKDMIQFVSDMFFRQSLIQTYKRCPQKALYSILSVEAHPPWFASVMGTAGHEVLYHCHAEREFDLTKKDISNTLYMCFKKAYAACDPKPNIAKGYNNYIEEYEDKCDPYIEMIFNYLRSPRTQNFFPQIFEQNFVLEVPDSINPDNKPFYFVGQIDLAGFDSTGLFHLRDPKFRDDAFKPSYAELALNTQLTVYTKALRDGVPTCDTCKPKIDQITFETSYTGPCKECREKIGTPKWPQILPDRSCLVWMRDFLMHDTDQYKRYVKDPNKQKTRNISSGKMVIRNIENPKWREGYKAGQLHGEGFLETNRDEDTLSYLMGDVSRICSAMRAGLFYRAESKDCSFMCEFREQCLAGKERDITLTNNDRSKTLVDSFNSNHFDPFE